MAALSADNVAAYVRVVLQALDPATIPQRLPGQEGQAPAQAAEQPQPKRHKGEVAAGGGGDGGLASLADQLDVLANAAAAADGGVASPGQRQQPPPTTQQQQQAPGAGGAAPLAPAGGSGALGEAGLVPSQAAASAQRNLEAAARAFEQADTADPASMLAPFKCLLRAQPGSRTLRVGLQAV